MDRKKQYKTKYQGVFYRQTKEGKSYVIRYKGKAETLNVSDVKEAVKIRAERLAGSEVKSQTESKTESQVESKTERTLEEVFQKYKELFEDVPGKNFNDTRKIYQNRLRKNFGKLKVSELNPYLIKAFTNSMYREGLADATIKHHLVHLNKLLNFASEIGLCDPISFKIEKPKVNNEKTEDLTKEQLENLKSVLESYPHKDISTIFWIALYTGFRSKSILSLRVEDLDFNRKLITLRTQKNGNQNRAFPMSGKLEGKLKAWLKVKTESEWLFPSPLKDGHRTSIAGQAGKIRELAGLPKDFRPLHGLRHVYASTLASSGKVGMQTLQRLLDHKDYKMTSRYSHLRDEALRSAVDVLEDCY
ncbi:MAG: tyrosine-type recombinase/integrase [Desulforegulaceae bacterium]|nr:tyrosine-type recombinase/integrase [Desulforegulaceae bacterium]